MRIVEIDTSAGFCFGVEKAIDIAEQQLAQGEEVFGLGDMVHNDKEIDRLTTKGLKTIEVSDFKNISSGKVILRAHGEPPETYRLAKDHNVKIIDATCSIVKKLQQKVKTAYENLDTEKEQIVIFGKEGHAETIGLMGQTDGNAILITDPDWLNEIDKDKSIILFSQTTMDPERFQEVEDNLSELTRIMGKTELRSENTICYQMKRRKPELMKFAMKHDTIIFVSGKQSSNGAMLYKYCRKHNKSTYWISSVDEIEQDWLSGEGSIGVSGATSTPQWQLEEVQKYLQKAIES
jgi:4-hydroxy-3-methylbut-2-en-1-yl diphosphate reductase